LARDMRHWFDLRAIICSKDQSLHFEIDVASSKVLWSTEKGFDISRYKALKHIRGGPDRACFNAYGACYLRDADLAFLKVDTQGSDAASLSY